jgi:hypothetical protein
MPRRHVVLLAAALLVMGTASSARTQTCTVEQGQISIDQARYKQAVKEFTCIIERHPTGVEGYRGRIEAQLLLGLYSDALGDYARVTALVLPVHRSRHHPTRLSCADPPRRLTRGGPGARPHV